MKEKSRTELDRADALIGKLDGIQAKLEVMAAAYQANGGIPSPALTEAALVSVAEEVREAAAAFRELRAGA